MRGKGDNVTALKFSQDAISRCFDISERLQRHEYEVGSYYPFKVYEPKERLVQAIDFEGKVVQHSFCDNALYPALAKRIITDNFACQIAKGTHFGLERLKKMLRHYYFSRKAEDDARRRAAGLPRRPMSEWNYADGYVLKGDFSKYFYNLRHDHCKEVASEALESLDDPEVIEDAKWLLDLFIDSTDDPGIPIGNQSSQLVALLYIDAMDHWLTDGLALPYGRYMDDWIVIDENKGYLKYLLGVIREESAKVGLTLNPKTQIFPLKNGIDFLGFHTYLTPTGKVVMKVRSKSISNRRRKIKSHRKMVDAGVMTLDQAWQSYQAWRAHIDHGDSHHLAFRMDEFFFCTFPELEGKRVCLKS